MNTHSLYPTILIGGDWNMTGLFFHSVGNGKFIPIDELRFFRGVGIPPTISIDYP